MRCSTMNLYETSTETLCWLRADDHYLVTLWYYANKRSKHDSPFAWPWRVQLLSRSYRMIVLDCTHTCMSWYSVTSRPSTEQLTQSRRPRCIKPCENACAHQWCNQFDHRQSPLVRFSSPMFIYLRWLGAPFICTYWNGAVHICISKHKVIELCLLLKWPSSLWIIIISNK